AMSLTALQIRLGDALVAPLAAAAQPTLYLGQRHAEQVDQRLILCDVPRVALVATHDYSTSSLLKWMLPSMSSVLYSNPAQSRASYRPTAYLRRECLGLPRTLTRMAVSACASATESTRVTAGTSSVTVRVTLVVPLVAVGM